MSDNGATLYRKMDPIAIAASLLTTIGAVVKEKAKGAAAKYLEDAVQERARRLWGVIGERDEESSRASW